MRTVISTMNVAEVRAIFISVLEQRMKLQDRWKWLEVTGTREDTIHAETAFRICEAYYLGLKKMLFLAVGDDLAQQMLSEIVSELDDSGIVRQGDAN